MFASSRRDRQLWYGTKERRRRRVSLSEDTSNKYCLTCLFHNRRAGVAGLTTALLLSEKAGYNIVVAAKHMPGDYDIEYASPWAGANYMP